MIDQIWYTWSSVGLGGETAGYRVRAASKGLSDLQGARYRAIDRYLRYQLPQRVDPNTMAPICLALIDSGQERLLVHKVYIGKDGWGRPGNFFAHLLAGLPEDFSARDAIRLWRSSLWQVSDMPLDQQPTTLKEISPDELRSYADYPTVTISFIEIQGHLSSIITAFLSRTSIQQHLYLVGDSEQVAMLIWGLTHCLPRTLLRGMTFSTYSYDLRKTSETIVGIVTPAVLITSGDSRSNVIIDCNTVPQPQTSPNPDIEAFALFATQWLVKHGNGQITAVDQLTELVTQAEREKIATVPAFINFFKVFTNRRPPLPPNGDTAVKNLCKAILRSDWMAVENWCKKFTALVPPAENREAWSHLLQSLSDDNIRNHAIQNWEFQQWLLTNLAETSPQPSHKQIYPWLFVPWDRLGELLTLRLPTSWHKLAIRAILFDVSQQIPSSVTSVVESHEKKFIEVLKEFIVAPSKEIINSAFRFVDFLVKNNYQEITRLLTALLNTPRINTEVKEQLLAMESAVTKVKEPLPAVETEGIGSEIKTPTQPAPTSPQLPPIHISRRTVLVGVTCCAIGGVLGSIVTRSLLSRPPQVPTPTSVPPTAIWEPTTNMLLPRQSFRATTLPDGQVLVEGGYYYISSQQQTRPESELFDPKTQGWMNTGKLNVPRAEHTATLLKKGKVLVTGGYSGQHSLNSVELYDPQTKMWKMKSTMSFSRTRHTATLLADGRVLIVGGVGQQTASVGKKSMNLNTAELYNPDTDTWSSAAPMATARADHVAVRMPDGSVLVAGSSAMHQPSSNLAEVYDPQHDKWISINPMKMPRAYFTAVLLPTGEVLVIGGRLSSNINDSTQTAEIYDPSTGRWSLTGNMHYPRQNPLGQDALLLENGNVLVVGGDDEGTSEIFSSAKGTWASPLNLDSSLYEGATALLGTGQVLVAGGELVTGDSTHITKLTEIYTPKIQ